MRKARSLALSFAEGVWGELDDGASLNDTQIPTE